MYFKLHDQCVFRVLNKVYIVIFITVKPFVMRFVKANNCGVSSARAILRILLGIFRRKDNMNKLCFFKFRLDNPKKNIV